MKNLRKIKLSNLSKEELGKKELNKLLGGENCCICGCNAPGGSGTVANGGANNAIGSDGQAGYGNGSYS